MARGGLNSLLLEWLEDAFFCCPESPRDKFKPLADMRSELLKNVSRIVVKVGTGVLTDNHKQLDLAQMQRLAEQIAAPCKAGRQIALVSSGAVGAGMGVLGYH